jgi:hypothetical protein
VSVQKFDEAFGFSSLTVISLARGVKAAVHVTSYNERRYNLGHGVEKTDNLVKQVVSGPVIVRMSIDV